MFTGMIIASVNTFSKGTIDKNGKLPVILNVVAGRFPNRNVLSGTVAESTGLEVGKTYLLSVREGEPSDQYGRQFVYNKLKELDAMEIVDAASKIGSATVFNVESVQAEETVETESFHKMNK
jgi:hypothetical protein